MTGFVAYFGYGSLVNRQTLTTEYAGVHRARLHGWRRHWQSRGIDRAGNDEIAMLSVHRSEDTRLDGMLVVDHVRHLPEVDLREERYDRVRLRREDIEIVDELSSIYLPDEIFLYVGKAYETPRETPKLLQSYLDAVMAGYLAEYGEAGLAGFVETTVGFERPILRDRHQPHYPRALPIPSDMAELFDAILKGAGVTFDAA